MSAFGGKGFCSYEWGARDGYQCRRGIFFPPPPICACKEVQGVEFRAVIWTHNSFLCHADADPRQGLESAARTKRLESAGRRGAPALCASEGKSRGHRALYANEGKFRGPYNRADVTF